MERQEKFDLTFLGGLLDQMKKAKNQEESDSIFEEYKKINTMAENKRKTKFQDEYTACLRENGIDKSNQ